MVNGSLPFLDVNVNSDSNCFTTTAHCKDTFSDVYTHFPDTYKRAYIINSSYQSLHIKIEKLKEIFKRNTYHDRLIEKCICRFFNKIFIKMTPFEQPDSKKEVMMVLPFWGSKSWLVKKCSPFLQTELFSCLKTNCHHYLTQV